MANEKFTVQLFADLGNFAKTIKKATKDMKIMGFVNRGLVKNFQKMNSSVTGVGKNFFQTTQKMKSGVDSLNKSTSGFNDKVSKNFKSVFDIFGSFFKGTKKAKSGIKDAGDQAKKSGGSFKFLGLEVGDANDNLKDSGDEAKKTSSKFVKLLKVVGLLGGAFVAAAGAFSLFVKAYRIAEIGAAIDVQAKAFANLVATQGGNAALLLRQLKEVSKGTLDNLSLMTTASRAILLGIATDKLVGLMRIARASAKAMGTTVAGAFSDIALGIGRQSRLILDNLGIIIRVQAAYERYANKVGVAANSLTDFEKRQAIADEVTRQGNKIVEGRGKDLVDFKDKVDRIRTAFKELQQVLALRVLTVFIAIFDVLEKNKILDRYLDLLTNKVPEAIIEMTGAITKFVIITGKKIEEIRDKFNFLIKLGILASRLVTRDFVSPVSELFGSEKQKKDDVDYLTETSKLIDKIFGQVKTSFSNTVAQSIFEKSLKPDFTFIEIATRKLEGFNQAVRDGVESSSDLSTEYGLLRGVVESAQRSINNEAFGNVTPFKPFDTANLDKVKNFKLFEPTGEVKKFNKELAEAEKHFKERIRLEGILETKGSSSTRQLNEKAKRAISSLNEVVKSGLIKNQGELLRLFNSELALFKDRVAELEPEVQESFNKLRIAISKIPTDDRIQKGFNQWVDNFNNTTDRLTKIGNQVAESLATGFDNFFFDTITGKIGTLKEAFDSLFKSILRSVTRFLGEKATQEFLGLAFGATGSQSRSNIGPTLGGKGGLIGKAGGFIKGLFSRGGGSTPSASAVASAVPRVPSNQMFGASSSLGGVGGILSTFSSIGKVLGFADGGITSLANAGSSAMIAKRPTLAAIAEKPGKSEAIVPLDKFSSLLKPVTLNINAIDTKSFSQYMNDNKETVLGAIMNIKGGSSISKLNPFSSGPF